ncbi:hypothetical protein G7Z17_g7895 [Cylindrodendrum hubeiense]|uniref:Uncharacterized protein n=1 Tax=Cylindrodendrum hubeiense TaxID=595255 RepID=A0A9P5LDR4_9HYPO|nr:hypothetical protein G7Z17_g7895 [Cylindrodendrum hubeiense]
MDWPHDNVGFSESDLTTVFKYAPRDSTVVSMLASNQPALGTLHASNPAPINNALMRATVYNCRSSNAWETDLALSETYFPESSLTFAILYGCTASIEKDIIERLSFVREEATHPVLMPGIFAELERSRHRKLVQSSIAELEEKILELDMNSDDVDTVKRAATDKKNVAKRTAWLDTTYLRNGLMSWSTQLGRMIQSLKELENATSRKRSVPLFRNYRAADQTPECTRRIDTDIGTDSMMSPFRPEAPNLDSDSSLNDDVPRGDERHEDDTEVDIFQQGDSNGIKIGNIDSQSTFLAGIFSMSFFDWNSGSSGGVVVSKYVWIYVVIAVILTLLTVGVWYYLSVLRPRRLADRWNEEDDEEDSLV